MSDTSAPGGREASVALIGIKSAGKTLSVFNIVDCIDSSLHGYPVGYNLEYVGMSDSLSSEMNKMHSIRPSNTSKSDNYTFKFELKPEIDALQKWEVKCKDVPGEIFLKDDLDAVMQKERDAYEAFIPEASGAVFMLSALDLRNASAVSRIFNEILELKKNGGADKNVILVITMFELFLVPFGAFAAQFVCKADNIKGLLSTILGPSLPRSATRDNRNLRVSAMSSFGFVAGLGSPNVSPVQGVLVDTTDETSEVKSSPYVPNTYYPFLVADPFIFAATGIDNPFIFSLSEVMSEHGAPQ